MNKINIFLKGFLTLILIILLNMNTAIAQKKISKSNGDIVLKYDYSPEQFIKASSVEMFRDYTDGFHKRGSFNVIFLGEKKQILFPDIKEIYVNFFNKKFCSLELFFYEDNKWKNFERITEEINKKREQFKELESLALKKEGLNLHLLSPEFMRAREGIIINQYDLEHYSVFLVLKKFNIYEEIYPRYILEIKIFFSFMYELTLSTKNNILNKE
jgi:hypothetical protein